MAVAGLDWQGAAVGRARRAATTAAATFERPLVFLVLMARPFPDQNDTPSDTTVK
jgi:hypothetical protein